MSHARNILVTGAASGIGRALVGQLVDAGHHVVATDRDRAGLERAAEAWPGVEVRGLDVTCPLAWEAAVAAMRRCFGPVDVLVNVAGVLVPGWAHEIPQEAVDAHVDVNLKGVVHGMRAVIPDMIERRAGHVVNVASLAALAPVSGLALYAATKYAVRGYSLSVAQELRRHGVAVTVVCPDAVDTPMLDVQRGVAAAELTFSGPRVLTPPQVGRAIVRALERRPLEVWLPGSRGWMARMADLLPGSARLLDPLLRWQGRRNQRF